jgi:hypothetical protein
MNLAIEIQIIINQLHALPWQTSNRFDRNLSAVWLAENYMITKLWFAIPQHQPISIDQRWLHRLADYFVRFVGPNGEGSGNKKYRSQQ